MNSAIQMSREVRCKFEQIILPYRSMLWSYCFTLTKSPWDAEDLLQETLLRSLSKMHLYHQEINIKAYLFKTAKNIWIDEKRRNKVSVAENEIREIEDVDNVEQQMVLRSSIEYLITLLPPKQRIIFILTYVFQLPIKEVAELLNMNENSVKQSSYRARYNLQKKSFITESLNNTDENSVLLDKYIECIRKNNPSKLVHLINEEITVDISGVSFEEGKKFVSKNYIQELFSLSEYNLSANIFDLWGKNAVVVFEIIKDEKTIIDVHDVQSCEGEVITIKDYFYCPEFLEAVGKEIGYPYKNNGYFWD